MHQQDHSSSNFTAQEPPAYIQLILHYWGSGFDIDPSSTLKLHDILGIHLRTIPLEMFKISVTKLHLKIKNKKPQQQLSGSNELIVRIRMFTAWHI